MCVVLQDIQGFQVQEGKKWT